MVDFSKFKSLKALFTHFVDNNVCKQYLAEARWADGDVVCPYCGGHHCGTRADGRYRCNHCKRNFSVLVGTIFENTKMPLVNWFMAIYLYSSHKKGISSCQLSRDLGVTQDTAWYMLSKIRLLSAQDGNISLEGVVELDEAYIGGEEKWKHDSKKTEGTQGRSLKTKTPVFGLAERKGSIIVKKVENTQSATLLPIIEQHVKEGSKVFTDEYQAYCSLGSKKYLHSIVFHKEKKFVDGDVSTNSVESFWSHFKRMLKGIYHYVSAERIQMYVDEEVYRWNTRKQDSGTRVTLLFNRANGFVVTHKQIASMYITDNGGDDPTPIKRITFTKTSAA